MHFDAFLALFKDKPYIDSKMFALLGLPVPLIRNQITFWQKKGFLKKLRRGIYIFSETYKDLPERELISGVLVQPSYLSLEYVLSLRGMIPEAVFSCTSVTTRKPVEIETALGRFIYKHVSPQYFWGFTRLKNGVLLAETEKALLDLLYLKYSRKDFSGDFFIHALRLQNIEQLSQKKLLNYAERYASPALQQAVAELVKIWKKL